MYPIPVLFVFYKRKKLALKTFSQIAKVKPKYLYLFSDYSSDPKIQLEIDATRQAILAKINWPAITKTFFSDSNFGLKYYQFQAMNWVLKQCNEKYVIYIEDDIYCSEDFFRFQQFLLPKYQNDNRILGIAGYNFGLKLESNQTYFLSRLGWCWGIGFYSRILQYYNPDIPDYFSIKNDAIYKSRFLNKKIYYALDTQLSLIARNKLVSPDMQVYYTSFRYDKYFIVSCKKLVENLGFNVNGHNAFLFTYRSQIERLTKLKYDNQIEFDNIIEKKYYDTILQGGWIRLVAIRIFLNLPFRIRDIIYWIVIRSFKLLSIKKQ